ncbi:MAG TPA: 5'-nucleotidase C-terminal domain-containing protein [Longimicrobiales bacterium]
MLSRPLARVASGARRAASRRSGAGHRRLPRAAIARLRPDAAERRRARRAPALRLAALLLPIAAASCAPGGVTPATREAPAGSAGPEADRAPELRPTIPRRAGAHDGGATRELILLGTTDVHGRLLAHDYYTGRATDHGLALLKPIVDSIRAANPGRVYLFDSGDLLQGNPLAYVHARREPVRPNPIIRAMNLLRYDAAAIGNHEFNYGIPHLDRAVEDAAFPFVSGNIFRHGTDAHAYAPYVLLPHPVAEGDTILIGVTGNTPPGVHVWDRANVEGVLDFRDVVASLRPVIGEMRARGADLVVVLSHGGFGTTSYDTIATGLAPENVADRLAREVPGIDVVFLGHTHRELADSTIAGVLFTQPRPWGGSLAAVTVRLERRAPGVWRAVDRRATILRPDPDRADAAFVAALRPAHERTIAYVNSVIGRSTARWDAREARVRDTPILDFINEVQRRATGADLSATAAFNLSAAIPEGDVTVADLAGLYIYDNTLKVIRITGAQLDAYLEHSARYYRGWPTPDGGPVTDPEVPGYNFDVVSGVDYVIDLSRPVGDRVTGLRYRGAPVRPDQTFTLAVNNYRQGGGGGYTMIADAPVVYDRQEDIRELLIEEVRRRGTIRPEDYFRENWRLLPVEAAEAARREQGATPRTIGAGRR